MLLVGEHSFPAHKNVITKCQWEKHIAKEIECKKRSIFFHSFIAIAIEIEWADCSCRKIANKNYKENINIISIHCAWFSCHNIGLNRINISFCGRLSIKMSACIWMTMYMYIQCKNMYFLNVMGKYCADWFHIENPQSARFESLNHQPERKKGPYTQRFDSGRGQ